MSTPEEHHPSNPLRSQEDIILILRSLLSLAHNPIGPSLQAENWSLNHQGGSWWSYPMGKPDTEVQAHDTLAQALRRTGDVKLAQILEWASKEVGDALTQGPPENIGVPEWPPTVPVLKTAMIQAHPTAIVQEVRVHESQYKALVKLWRKTNTAEAHFDRHRPFPYARVVATGQSPHVIEAIILEQGDATCEADCKVKEVWFYSQAQATPKKSPRKKKVTP